MATAVKFSRIDTAANFTSASGVVAPYGDGELLLEKDTNRVKWGDGVTDWNALPYRLESTGGGGAVDSVNGQTGVVVLNKADIGLGNVDNTSDALKPVSTATQTALDNKLEATDIGNFETTAQLNTRDINNRNRANHTGTQFASTISNFAATVRDTLLSGIVTTVNAANLVPVAAADTVLSAIGKLQARTALLFYGEFARNTTSLLNNTTAEADFLVLNANTPINGNYKAEWAYDWSGNDGAQDCIIRLYLNGVLWTQVQEPKDVAGTGVNLPAVGGGTTNSGTSQRHLVSTFDILPLVAGPNEIKITLDSSATGDRNSIYKGVVAITKFGVS